MVMAGVEHKAARMSSDIVLDALKLRYPNRFDFPTSHHIGSYMTSCMNTLRNKAKRAADHTSAYRYVMPNLYCGTL